MSLENIVNSGKKIIGTSLLVGALTFSPLLAGNVQAQNNQESNKKAKTEQKLSFSAGFVFKYETPLISMVKNIPFEIRDVPGYPPIEEDNVEIDNQLSLGIRLGGKIPFDDNIKLNLGMGFDVCIGEEGSPDSRATYYFIKPKFIPIKNQYLRPTLFSEIETKITEKIRLGLGHELFGKKIIVENGWDTHKIERRVTSTSIEGYWYEPVRVGEYIPNKTYNLANIIVGNLYVSLKFYKESKEKGIKPFMYYYAIDFGLIYPIKKGLTDWGKQMDIDYNDKAWFVGFKIGK